MCIIANCSRSKSFVVAELNCTLLENFHGWTVVLHGQSLLHKLVLPVPKIRGYHCTNV